MTEKLIKMSGEWDGWLFDENSGTIFDEGGNPYQQEDIRGMFYFKQWLKNGVGNKSDIYYLKEELLRKVNKKPILKIMWNGEEQEITLS